MTCKNDSNQEFEKGLCAECYVRYYLDFVRVLPEGEIRLHGVLGPWFLTWKEAAEFVLSLNQEIAEIEEEIALLDFMSTHMGSQQSFENRIPPFVDAIPNSYVCDQKIFRRIADSRREALKEKKRGMEQ